MNKSEVLIVGINNFLGRAIFELVREDFNITGIFNANKENIPEGIEVLQIDSISNLKGRPFKYIYLISSYVPGANRPEDDRKLLEVNILLPKKITSLFPDARIIFCSSVSVYENRAGNDIISIEERPSPLSKYAISKFWGEQIIKEQDSFAILRISSMYGAGMNKGTFLPKVIEKALKEGQITLLGEGERMQNYVHVDDVAKIAVQAAAHENNVILLAVSNHSYSNKEIATAILELIPGILSYTGLDNSRSNVYNNDFTHQTLCGLEFKDIKEGLKELKEWIKKEY